MKNTKSNSKKVFQPSNQSIGNIGKNPLNSLMRRFKSQDKYAISQSKKNVIIQSKVLNDKGEIGQTNQANTSPTHMKPQTENNTPNAHKLSLHSAKIPITPTKISKATASNNQRVLISPFPCQLNQSSEPRDTTNNYNYLSSRPIHPPGFHIINLFNDESIQELDTEENINTIDDSKKCEYTISINEFSNSINNVNGNGNNQQPHPIVNSNEIKFIDESIQIGKPNTVLSNYSYKKSRDKNVNLSNIDMINNQNSFEKKSYAVNKKDFDLFLMRQFLQMARKGDKDSFLELFEKVLNENTQMINFQDEQGLTALHYASDEGNLKIVEILVKGNADVNIKSKNKRTPLHLSSHQGYFDISKLLIENGAVINCQDNERNTPIHLCVICQHSELLKYLLERYPQADSKNIYGKTPFDLANSGDIRSLLSDYLKKAESRYHKIRIHNANDSQAMTMFSNSNMCQEVKGKKSTKGSIDLTPKEKGKKYKIRSGLSEKKKMNNTTMSNNQIQTNHININISANMCNVVNLEQESSKKNLMSKEHSQSKVQVGISDLKSPPSKVINSYSKKTMGNTLTSPTKSINQFLLSKGNSKNKFDISKPIKPVTLFTTANTHLMNCEIKIANVEINLADSIPDSNSNNPLCYPKANKQIENSESLREQPEEESFNAQNNNSVYVEEEKVNPSMFVIKGLLGKGSFGEVYLVEKNNCSSLYAMKVLNKEFIMKQNIVKYAMTERNILSITSHPFIVKLSYAFQTTHQLFLILDYCPGGDLSKHLASEKKFTEERAKIYLCEIILALGDLHQRDIIFRDLKPDNIVLDKDGHAMLTDFGLSKEGVYNGNSTKSFCGSIAYLAPEMLQRQGHGKAVDWYLLGVLFYEMLVGVPPYFTRSKEQIFHNIKKGDLQIPKFISEKAKKLLTDLLQKNTNQRLGSFNDIDEIKQHEYFKDINWDDVYKRKLNPPKPQLNNFVSYSKPRTITEEEYQNSNTNVNNEKETKLHFDGWSFIQKETNTSLSSN